LLILNAYEYYLLLSAGKHHSAQEAANIGLLDRIYPASSDVVRCAIEFSKTLTRKSLSSRRISLLPVSDSVHVGI